MAPLVAPCRFSWSFLSFVALKTQNLLRNTRCRAAASASKRMGCYLSCQVKAPQCRIAPSSHDQDSLLNTPNSCDKLVKGAGTATFCAIPEMKERETRTHVPEQERGPTWQDQVPGRSESEAQSPGQRNWLSETQVNGTHDSEERAKEAPDVVLPLLIKEGVSVSFRRRVSRAWFDQLAKHDVEEAHLEVSLFH